MTDPYPKILLIDDDTTTGLIGKSKLEQYGCTVEVVNSGKKALEQFEASHFDILLLDVMMPEMDGFTTCLRIRDLPDGEQVPILMMTGLDDSDSINKAYECGATDFIVKPVEWKILFQRIQYMLRACDNTQKLAHTLSQLQQSEARLAKAQQIAELGNWEWYPESNHMFWSEETFRILHYDPETTTPTFDKFIARVHPDEKDEISNLLDEVTRSGETVQLEHRIRDPQKEDDEFIQQRIEQEKRDDKNDINVILGTIQNVTAQVHAKEKIRYLAYYDKLTGLPNRSQFNERINEWINYAERYHRKMAMLFLDLDNFKKINDSFGHTIGDRLLQEIAARLETCVRDSDMIARTESNREKLLISRFGGDEFTLLLSHIQNPMDAALVAKRINKTFAKPITLKEQEIYITASIGISIFPEDGGDVETLLKNADTAMYHSKDLGSNNYQFFSESMNTQALARLTLESGLRKALEQGELIPYFQPKMNLQTQRIESAEVLLRWQHPELGWISPNDFIPIAEEAGIIVPLGEWLVDTVCAQLKCWETSEAAGIKLAINISAQHLKQTNFLGLISDSLNKYGITPSSLELEITENSLINDAKKATSILKALSDQEVMITIDDFGTGYSSLSYLQKLPIHTLKIDKSFVRNIEHDVNNATLTRAIIAMAHNLNLQVIAEGIENESQLNILKRYGCDEIQGYLVSKPLALEDFERFMANYTSPPI